MKQIADLVNQLAPLGLVDELPGVRQAAEMFGYLDPVPDAEPDSMRLADLLPEFAEDTLKFQRLIANGGASSEDAMYNELRGLQKHSQFLAWALTAVSRAELKADQENVSSQLAAWANAAEALSKKTLDRFGAASLASLSAQAAYGDARKAETKVTLRLAADVLGNDMLQRAAAEFDGPPVIMVEKILEELKPVNR